MKLNRNSFGVALGVLIVVGIVTPLLFALKERKECDQVIFLEGELSRDIRNVEYENYGQITRIYYCDGTQEDIPTRRVIKVVYK